MTKFNTERSDKFEFFRVADINNIRYNQSLSSLQIFFFKLNMRESYEYPNLICSNQSMVMEKKNPEKSYSLV